MKKVTLFVLFCTMALPSFSQSLGYTNLAVLLSNDSNSGTARYNAMSGAFGALGGDVSALKINPASGVVFKNSLFTATVNSNAYDINSSYYNNNVNTQEEYFNFSQAGAVFVYKTYDKDWTKFAFGFNYVQKNTFDRYFIAKGNSGFATFVEYPLDTNNPKTQYKNAESQEFTNNYKGALDEYNFTVSAVYQNNLHLGFAINTYELKFRQQSILREQNNDGSGNILNAKFYQQNNILGTGFSLGAGAIYKVANNLRVGFAYQTPTWFTEVNEESNIINNDGFFGDTEISVSNNNVIYDNTSGNNFPVQAFTYKLKTPAKTTASVAYVFGGNGLLSADYTMKNYRKIKLSNADFSSENQTINNDLKNTYSLNVGTEWRFKSLSLRGGYHYEENPYKDAIKSDNITGYSFGAGFNFGNTKLDFAYQTKTNTEPYNFYPQYNQVKAAELNIDNKVITATLTINL
ncbi:MAG: hemin receptor [Flavobacteriaceae bacterium]|nr:hemin receptor [Flavobacteriaceae bacterium]